MVSKELLDQVNKLGVPMLAPVEEVDANATLAEVVKSHEARLWENFPALLAAASQKYSVDLKKVSELLTQDTNKKAFDQLCALSNVVYEKYHFPFESADNAFQTMRDAFKSENVLVSDLSLSVERLKNAFEDYLSRVKLDEQKERVKYEELSLEFSLSQVFSPKQKELFRKKLRGEPLTKTEREYFSRTVKKKVLALANDDLHKLARGMVG